MREVKIFKQPKTIDGVKYYPIFWLIPEVNKNHLHIPRVNFYAGRYDAIVGFEDDSAPKTENRRYVDNKADLPEVWLDDIVNGFIFPEKQIIRIISGRTEITSVAGTLFQVTSDFHHQSLAVVPVIEERLFNIYNSAQITSEEGVKEILKNTVFLINRNVSGFIPTQIRKLVRLVGGKPVKNVIVDDFNFSEFHTSPLANLGMKVHSPEFQEQVMKDFLSEQLSNINT